MSKLLSATCISLLAMAASGNAATYTFAAGSFVDQDGTPRSIFDVSISDIVGGVNVAVSRSGAANGDVLLLGLEGFNLTGATFTINSDPDTGDGITAVCTTGTVSGCGGNQGGDFTGGAFNSDGAFGELYGFFDTILRIGTQGAASGLNNFFDIDITNTLATAMDFEAVGLRVLSTSGVGGAESLKIYSDTPAAVPVPAAGFLMIGALGGLAALRRRRRAV